jgi:hypothetical protein
MDHSEIVKEILEGEKPVCPYCKMEVSRISTSERVVAVCGWCNMKWIKEPGRLIEQNNKSKLIMFMPNVS